MTRDAEKTGLGNIRLTVLTFAILMVAIVALALITTLNRVEVRSANADLGTDRPPGTIGLAHPHPPLQRGPGEPISEPAR